MGVILVIPIVFYSYSYYSGLQANKHNWGETTLPDQISKSATT